MTIKIKNFFSWDVRKSMVFLCSCFFVDFMMDFEKFLLFFFELQIEDNDLRSNLPSLLHMSPGLNKSLSAPPTPPFGYPLSALGIGLFDADPSRLLSILHHQTLLAEEALR